ncbi:phosphoribosylamine--glycine ligase [Hydrogenimonas thermophila]|uniref:Phosphoribosylamine--glycine ligase n=1 Tax=Hydrogenimonas thermophila TaxID=223786 RepID=A0A1I5MA39_9BACT|nr:phosphoribosylamine--glycine ligase [Hydrogenimonas thermophila]WOE70619.1 phosphoribosylamine--glycine ligase [Hydrogenimonas thermophila]WOE73137.1 phosphoribosylamine--glycine ligase [Hydrogenimonas thermophila]SFP06454.1 phosphoribosylamine--glycine ligase [Hydrogenimonas thermophila]
MKVLVVGSGGREYAIGQALKRDENVEKVYFAPGNGATWQLGENINISDHNELADYIEKEGIDLTVVGPEAPLVAGIVDIFKERGLKIFGPSKKAAQLEGSKIFMKNFLARHNIPTARYIETDSIEEAFKFIDSLPAPIVVKADGLCAGKGVIIAPTHDDAKKAASEMLSGKAFGEAGTKIVVEEFLDGYELSLFAICDGKDFVLLPAAQDHKRLLDNDEGPNTGGMGAYAPTPLIDEELYKKIEDRIIRPTIDGMAEEGMPFEGVLFAGLMIVNGEPYTLEFNVRFGDPECEVLMPLLKTPAGELFDKAASGKLDELKVEFIDKYAVGVVMASRDYPYKSSEPAEIIVDEIVHKELKEKALIAYAGVSLIDEKLMATGGRVLVCVGLGDSIKEARDNAYMLCGQVHFAGKQCRSDIAYQALKGD